LFTPANLGSVMLKNRIVFPPMTTRYANDNGTVSLRMIEHYRRIARGGVGLIVIEMACVTQDERGFTRQLGIWGKEFQPGLRALADSIHIEGIKVFLQLQHGGREAYYANSKNRPVAPSSVRGGYRHVIPRKLTIREINKIVQDFAEAAVRAREAGFDGVEFHGAHIYLIQQFLSPLTNKRTDRYGGNIEGRARFAQCILNETRRRAGKEFPISFRINGEDFVDGGLTIEQSEIIAQILENAGATCIHVSGGTVGTSKMIPSSSEKEGCLVYLAERIKHAINIPVITVGKITDPWLADRILAEGRADFVAMGRALIADTELPKKAGQGKLDEIRRCISCRTCHNSPDGSLLCNARRLKQKIT